MAASLFEQQQQQEKTLIINKTQAAATVRHASAPHTPQR
jgi:hypothetical protein